MELSLNTEVKEHKRDEMKREENERRSMTKKKIHALSSVRQKVMCNDEQYQYPTHIYPGIT